MTSSYILTTILVIAAITCILRSAPFVLFKRSTPKPIEYLSKVLPEAVIAMLVVYCLRNIHFESGSHGLPELISVALVAIIHKWKHNTLLSIISGTVLYMILIQLVF